MRRVYKLWTAREAIAKLQGKGLAEALRISLDPAELDAEGSEGEVGVVVMVEETSYELTRRVHPEYVYTIARKACL